jgi:hypothetical protein
MSTHVLDDGAVPKDDEMRRREPASGLSADFLPAPAVSGELMIFAACLLALWLWGVLTLVLDLPWPFDDKCTS